MYIYEYGYLSPMACLQIVRLECEFMCTLISCDKDREGQEERETERERENMIHA